MNTVDKICCYGLNDKLLLLISDEYKGCPLIMWPYDVLICSEEIFLKYKDELIADHLRKEGWYPSVRFI